MFGKNNLVSPNEAFIISTEKREEILANCQSEDECEWTAELIRPNKTLFIYFVFHVR